MKKYILCLVIGFFIGLVIFFGSIVTGELGVIGGGFVIDFFEHVLNFSPSSLSAIYLENASYSLILGLISAIVYSMILIMKKSKTTFSFLFFSFLFFSLGIYIPSLLFTWAFLAALSHGQIG